MTHEIPTQEDVVLDGFLALDTPLGFRAELIEGEIIVTPPPTGNHEHIISEVLAQILTGSATAMHFSGNKGLRIVSTGTTSLNHVIPDGTFAPRELNLFRAAEPWMPPKGVAMVLEVTSQRAEIDREAKRVGYAHSGIPLYLLVDRTQDKVTLFSLPEKGDYTEIHTGPFGKQLDLPEPFSMTLETKNFV